MNPSIMIGFVNLFCVGLLAGEEVVIRYGVRAPIATLDEKPHIEVRQALIRPMRILVPMILFSAILTSIAVTIIAGTDRGFGLRCAGLLAYLTFIGVTFGGTVPLNQAVMTWNPVMPPGNWRSMITQWERLDTVRCWAAIIAFMLFLTAMALTATALP